MTVTVWCVHAQTRPMRACRSCDASVTVECSVCLPVSCVYYFHIQHAWKSSARLSSIRQASWHVPTPNKHLGAFWKWFSACENKCISFICLVLCMHQKVSHVPTCLCCLLALVRSWACICLGWRAFRLVVVSSYVIMSSLYSFQQKIGSHKQNCVGSV